jgi:hypothetical protein
MTPQILTFSIENETNPETDAIYGSKYTGTFSVRRPSLRDKINIQTAKTRILTEQGNVAQECIDGNTRMLAYIFAFVATCKEADIPTWFNLDELVTVDDENAAFQVLSEVSTWLSTF